ncbi:MAG TPA: YggS family pyridoxal phosphate-dependent enzyme [Bacilli bacterium]
MNLQDRKQLIEDSIRKACLRSGRARQDVEVIAVTKYVNLGITEQVLEQGWLHIGENRWQDAQEKWEKLGSRGTWHFIGHLQSNKVKDVIGKFQYIHSLDRISLVREIERQAELRQMEAYCFIQVNVSGELSKFGLSAEQFFPFVEALKAFPHIRIAGLMTMAPHEKKPEETRPVFRGLRLLRDQLNERNILGYEVPHLSMGMSNDYEVAIEEGSTWIRLGSILVGKDEE